LTAQIHYRLSPSSSTTLQKSPASPATIPAFAQPKEMRMIALIWRCLKHLTLIVCRWLIQRLETPQTQARTIVSYGIVAPLWPTTLPNAQPNFLAHAIFKGLTEPAPLQPHKPFHRFRKKAKTPETPTFKNAPKAKWIVKEVLTLIALMPNVGCRKIAATFNLRHA
jgi:putative transposase